MVELHHVVGAILRNISQARVAADIFSRDISRYYEQDALLRRFPIPRAEIEELEIELKFSIASVERQPGPREAMEAVTAPVLARFSYTLAALFFEVCLRQVRSDTPEASRAVTIRLPEAIYDKLQHASARIYLHQDILHYLGQNQGILIREGQLDEAATVAGLQRAMQRVWDFLFEGAEVPPNDAQNLQDAIFSAMDLPTQVRLLQTELRAAWEDQGDYWIDVQVTTDALQATPEAVISTLKFKTTVRNYLWSQVDTQDGRIWRAISPE